MILFFTSHYLVNFLSKEHGHARRKLTQWFHSHTRSLDAQLGGQQKKIDDHVAQLCDYEMVNKRMAAENGTLFTRLEELNGNAGMLQKIKVTLSSQLDDAKRACDEEAKERQSLLGR